jgi:hypothetical protein
VDASTVKEELLREGEDADEVGDTEKDDGGTDKLHLKSRFNFWLSLNLHYVGREGTHYDAYDNAHCDKEEGVEQHREVLVADVVLVDGSIKCIRGDDKCGASRLCEGAEKISTHTSNVTDIITDVVSNGSRVLGGVFREACLDLSYQIGTNISSLSIDTATNSTEKRNE